MWALLMNINVELCPFLRRVSSSLPLQLFCRHKSAPLKSNIIIFYCWQFITTCDLAKSSGVPGKTVPCVFIQIYWLWCLKIYFEDDLWVCFLMRLSMGQSCLAQWFIKGWWWLFIYLYTELMIQCMTLFFFFFFLEFRI